RLDVLSPLAGHALAALVVGSLALVAWRRARMAVLVAGCLAIVLAHAAPALDTPPAPAVLRAAALDTAEVLAGADRLVVLQINTWHSNRAPDRLVAYLEASDADVVLLSEFGPEKQELVGRLARRFPHVAGCAEYWPCSQMLLSRRPLAASGTRLPDASGPPIVWAHLAGSGGRADVTVVGTHLYRPTRDYDLHQRHLAGLARFVAGIEGEVIVAGDLNMTAWSKAHATFMSETGLAASPTRLPTWPAWPLTLPQFQIDHLLATPGLTIERQAAGPYIGSDHLPLVSVVRLPARTRLVAERR
ncbi:MAG: endonuclease/exonuclease/phosphatase family protein, partial [Pseudomonadota bacterium]